MGYTHYFYRISDLDRELFKKVCLDFRKMNKVFPHMGFQLGNGFGEDEPTITFHEISFNGLVNCGHPEDDIGLCWPSADAGGVTIIKKGQKEKAVDGHWFAGQTLSTRTCGGDCSYESFNLEQHVEDSIPHSEEGKKDPYMFGFTKTNYRPYDIAVTVCLIIAKHHLGSQIRVRSDGESKDWEDARILCEQFLGYGKEFKLDDD